MNRMLKSAFESEMSQASFLYAAGDFQRSFRHLERAHILGQRFYIPHVISHWWMLKVGFGRMDLREIVGQILRIAASVGSLLGWVPVGNTGGANVSPIRPMPIPKDLVPLLKEERQPTLLGASYRTIALSALLIAAYWSL